MTLFSAPDDPWSHRTRIVLAEKGISIESLQLVRKSGGKSGTWERG